MSGLNARKVFITFIKGIVLIPMLGIAISSLVGINIKDILFVEGLILLTIGGLSLMNRGITDLWISIDHNGVKSANEEVLIMEREREYILTKEVDINSIVAIILGFLTIALI